MVLTFFILQLSAYVSAVENELSPKHLLIVSDPYCPYSCEAESSKPGYLVEFAKLALNPLGYSIDYQVMPWKRVMHLAQQGKVDAVLTVERDDIESLIVGDVALAQTCLAIITRATDTSTWTGKESFKDKKIGIVNGYSYSISINNWLENSDDSLVKVSGNNALEILLNMINRGRIDATIGDCQV